MCHDFMSSLVKSLRHRASVTASEFQRFIVFATTKTRSPRMPKSHHVWPRVDNVLAQPRFDNLLDGLSRDAKGGD